MNGRPLIIDCDPGQDDAVALLLAFASPRELDVLAVTTVAGNVALGHTTRNGLRICELAGRRDVAVHAGCARPILGPPATAAHIHGDDGLAGAELPEPAEAPRAQHAVDVLIETVMARKGEITLAALGPLTNIARAMVKEPRMAPGLREIVVMGGSLGAGNVTPFAEFNIHADPHAAAAVFSAGAPLTMIGLDVTHRAIATAPRVAAIRDLGRPAADTVAAMMALHLGRRENTAGEAGGAVHDACVVAYLLRPDLFATRAMRIAVETADAAELGRTRADASDGAEVSVAVDIDADGFFDLLTGRLALL